MLRGRYVDPDPFSVPSISRVKEWVNACLQSHQKCNIATKDWARPDVDTTSLTGKHITIDPRDISERLDESAIARFLHLVRFLDLVSHETGQSVFLVSVTEISTRYVTLSHRWNNGPRPEWVTQKTNIGQRMDTFQITGLPGTIENAIRVSRLLDYRYLWTDSLCIVQDDAQDWERQASQVSAIYLHGQLTIAADSANDDNAGFSQLRRSVGDRPVAFKVRHHEESHVELIARYYNYCHEGLLLSPPEYGSCFYRNVVESILSHRGWTLQERLLAPRILHYGVEQMFWECRECVIAEDVHVFPNLRDMKETSWLPTIQDSFFGENPDAFQIFKAWTLVVGEYTKRRLTNPVDALPAISAIARLIARRIGGTYLDGLWKETLDFDLLWLISNPDDIIHECSQRCETWRGPSWSWLFLKGPVRFDVLEQTNLTGSLDRSRQELYKPTIELLDTKLVLSSQDPLGPVERATLTLAGPTKPACFEISVGSDECNPLYNIVNITGDDEGLLCQRTSEPIGRLFNDIAHRDVPPWQHTTEGTICIVKCLKTIDVDRKEQGISVFANCLILMQRPAAPNGVYIRIGVGYIWGDRYTDWFKDAEKEVLRLC